MKQDNEREKAFDKFYNSKEARDYCFGNYNNATRDEQVGEFSFNAGYDYRNAEIKKLRENIKFLLPYFNDCDNNCSYGRHSSSCKSRGEKADKILKGEV